MTDPALQALLHRYRQGACTPAETRAVEAWYAAQPDGPEPVLAADEREALRRRLWQRLRPAPLVAARPAAGAPSGWHWLAAAAVAVGLGVGSGLLAPRPRPAGAPVAWQERANATARTQQVLLPDGSAVALEPGSRLRYRPGFAGGQRAVYLRGEAFFRVAHDAAHPFRVLTTDLETRVLGTSFRVRAYPQQAETVVQVRTGRVRVQPLATAPEAPAATAAPGAPAAPLVLLPNQQAVYAPKRQQLRRELVPQPAQLAPQPFAYDNRPVAEVLGALQAAYGVPIRYRPAAVAGCTVNLNLHGQASLFAKLDALCLATGATYTQADAEITFHSAGCQPI
ncbi:FecR family protein [Hymenobacter nivis]|nr:FecR domain-containing protein [Hymenobacter nivis]